MKKLLNLSALLLIFITTSCSSDSDDNGMNPPPAADVTYAGNIKAIIDGACLGCHTDPPINNAPMALITFENVRDAVNNRGLVGRVENGSMPPGNNDLTTAQVQAIKDWQAGGFKQ